MAKTRTPSAWEAAAKRALAAKGKTPTKLGPKPVERLPAGSPIAAPASAAPPIAPFLNSDDLQALANFQGDLAQKVISIDSNLANLQADTNYQRTQTDQQAKQATSGTTDAMIARGLFQSSVKDAAVYDIEAQRTLQQGLLNDRLTRATLDADAQKKALYDWKTNFDKAQSAKMVENAASITPTVPAPAAPSSATISSKPLAAPSAKPQVTGTSPQPTTKRQADTARAAAAAYSTKQSHTHSTAVARARGRSQ